MKNKHALIALLFVPMLSFCQLKDSTRIQIHAGLMGRWQSGNLEQLSVMPNARFAFSKRACYAELNTNYHYLKVGDFNAVNDLWVNAIYQHQPHKTVYPMVYTNNGFAASYKIDFAALNAAGFGLNVKQKRPNNYIQVHAFTGYLYFEFENEASHSTLGFGSLIRAALPLSKLIHLKWELSSYHSARQTSFWGGGNFVQLNLRISPNLFANMRHQIYYNAQNIQNIKNYNSIMLFGIQYNFQSIH